MQAMLQIPEREVINLLPSGRKHASADPVESEILILTKTLSILGKAEFSADKRGLERLQLLHHAVLDQLESAVGNFLEAKMVDGRSLSPERRISAEAIISAYFDLLRLQSGGTAAAMLMEGNRITAEMEGGFRTISAILSSLGMHWSPEYPPGVGHSHAALRKALLALLSRDLGLTVSLQKILPPAKLPALTKIFSPPPGIMSSQNRRTQPSQGGLSWDSSAADARNTELGKAGEEFVLAVERCRLTQEGCQKLAERVTWTARDEGDGAGYDIASFNADGTRRLIEVKTTNGSPDTPFYITANEVRVSDQRQTEYWLYRVSNFSTISRTIFTIRGSLNRSKLALEPVLYRARLQSD